jgi:hypothetical protein
MNNGFHVAVIAAAAVAAIAAVVAFVIIRIQTNLEESRKMRRW